jgi:hypothetical protein
MRDITGFEPILDIRIVRFFLQFPVMNMEFVVADVEERLKYSHAELSDNLIEIIRDKLKEKNLGSVHAYGAYGDIHVDVELADGASEAVVTQTLGEACKLFWHKYQFGRTREVVAKLGLRG